MDITKITKAGGEVVPFQIEKLIGSLKRSGASSEVAHEIAEEINATIYEGMSTKEIYKKAFSQLKKTNRPVAARYTLKNAIMQLGPSGFPFERYLAEILKHQGYKVKVGEIVNGFCVTHEIDIIAEKDDKRFSVECKFHGDGSRKCNVKTPLYIKARFMDIKKQWINNPEKGIEFHQGWVATNTRFSDDAMTYGNCSGLYMLSWDAPKNESLRDRIDSAGLHPVTCLTRLTGKEKQALLEKNIVVIRDICLDEKILLDIGISSSRIENIMLEAKTLCNE